MADPAPAAPVFHHHVIEGYGTAGHCTGAHDIESLSYKTWINLCGHASQDQFPKAQLEAKGVVVKHVAVEVRNPTPSSSATDHYLPLSSTRNSIVIIHADGPCARCGGVVWPDRKIWRATIGVAAQLRVILKSLPLPLPRERGSLTQFHLPPSKPPPTLTPTLRIGHK